MPTAAGDPTSRRRRSASALVGVLVGGDDGDRAERRRHAADQQHGDPQQVEEQHQPAPQRALERTANSGPVDDQVRARASSAGRLGGGDADADRALELARGGQRAQGAKASRSVRSSPPNSAALDRRPREQPPHRHPLVDSASGRISSTLRAEARDQALLLGERGDLAARRSAAVLVGGPAPVERLDRALVLEPQPGAAQPRPSRGGDEAGRRRAAVAERGVERGRGVAGPSSSRPWLPA